MIRFTNRVERPNHRVSKGRPTAEGLRSGVTPARALFEPDPGHAGEGMGACTLSSVVSGRNAPKRREDQMNDESAAKSIEIPKIILFTVPSS